MKKLLAICSITLAVLSLIGCISVSADGETTTVIETTTVLTTIEITDTADPSVSTFTYTDLDDLIDQIYAQVRQDIYDDLYAELSATLIAGIDEAIYAEVLAQIQFEIDSGTIHVNLATLQDLINDVVALSEQSVVGVTTYRPVTESDSLGSAVIYYHDQVNDVYYVITNEHVIESGESYEIEFADESTVPATLLGSDADIDIAVLSFSGVGLSQNLVVSPLGDSDELIKGSIILAAGNPRGYDFYGSVTMGIVSGIERIITTTDPVHYIQHDAAINSGNSGGPIYNLQGEVVGINVSKYASTDIEGMGFAIPINLVKTVVVRFAPATIE